MGEYDILPPLELPESKKQIEGEVMIYKWEDIREEVRIERERWRSERDKWLKYLVDRLKKIRGEDMLEQFNEEFIAKEIEEFFSKVKKGTLTHLQGISFIGKISGVIEKKCREEM